jgi:glycerol-3-phosphate acyltransferase PlsX
MRIAVDVMGGDHGPQVVIEGVKLALQASQGIAEVSLVGDQRQIESALQRAHCRDSRVRVVHASEVLTMQDNPLTAVRKKKDSSMARAIDLVKDGASEAVISPGNTGGLVAAASFKLRRLEGVDRPAIATVIPRPTGEFVLIDGGATPECKPLHLLQFAIMGNIYAREILGVKQPRVGLLSNGTEEMKGTDLTREAFKLCKEAAFDFVGYVEGHDLFVDDVDVVVTDGFVGNIVLKTIESMGKGITGLLKKAMTANALRKLGAGLASGAFRDIKHCMDPEEHGGAPLLGLNGNVIKIHGSARERMVKNAIAQSSVAVQHKLIDQIRDAIAAANKKLAPFLESAPEPSVA